MLVFTGCDLYSLHLSVVVLTYQMGDFSRPVAVLSALDNINMYQSIHRTLTSLEDTCLATSTSTSKSPSFISLVFQLLFLSLLHIPTLHLSEQTKVRICARLRDFAITTVSSDRSHYIEIVAFPTAFEHSCVPPTPPPPS